MSSVNLLLVQIIRNRINKQCYFLFILVEDLMAAAASWDTSSDQQYRNELSRITSQFNTNKTTLLNRAPAVVLGIQDAQNAVSSAKSEIESGMSILQTRDNELKSKLQSMLIDNEQSVSRIKMLETQVTTNNERVKEAEILNNLRKEQADELRRKGEGSFHSSWMGLWRPLSEQSRLGLIIATVFFGLISLFLITLFAKQLFPAVVAYFASWGIGSDPNFNIGSYQSGSGRRR